MLKGVLTKTVIKGFSFMPVFLEYCIVCMMYNLFLHIFSRSARDLLVVKINISPRPFTVDVLVML